VSHAGGLLCDNPPEDPEFHLNCEVGLELAFDSTSDGQRIVAQLRASPNFHLITRTKGTRNATIPDSTADSLAPGQCVEDPQSLASVCGTGRGAGTTMFWNPGNTSPYEDGTPRDPFGALLHELVHASKADLGASSEATV